MNTSTKWIVGVVTGAIVVGLVVVAAVAGLLYPIRSEPTPTTGPIVTETPAETERLADGEWFGFVTVEGEFGPTVVTVDVAEMLTGEPAREAAVKAGVIGEDEPLPNDFFIDNPDSRVVSMEVAPDAEITVLSGESPDRVLTIDGVTLEALFNGSYEGPAVYGIAPGQPIAVNLTVSDGMVTFLEAVYLP